MRIKEQETRLKLHEHDDDDDDDDDTIETKNLHQKISILKFSFHLPTFRPAPR